MPACRWSIELAWELQNIRRFGIAEWVDFVWISNNIFDWTERKSIGYRSLKSLVLIKHRTSARKETSPSINNKGFIHDRSANQRSRQS
jgi:hypothetical protein